MARYSIEFYGKKKNNEIGLFISSLQKSTIAKSLRIMDGLQRYGLMIGMPFVKKVDTDLYELRVCGNENVRYIFTTRGTIFHILHAFKKKTNKITKNDLTIAKNRQYTV